MGDGDISKSMDEKNTTVGKTDLNRRSKENISEHNNGNQTIIIVALTVISVFLIVCFVMIVIIYRKKGPQRYLFCCLQNVVNHHNHHNNMNFNARNVIVGDNSKILNKEDSDSEHTHMKEDMDND